MDSISQYDSRLVKIILEGYELLFDGLTEIIYNGLPSNWQSILTPDEFPFFHKQYKKNPDVINDSFKILSYDDTVVAFICFRKNKYDDLFPFETTHISDLEVSESSRGKGYFKKMMNNLPEGKLTLQANTDDLIKTYEKYGFHLYGNPSETGNLMINFANV